MKLLADLKQTSFVCRLDIIVMDMEMWYDTHTY